MNNNLLLAYRHLTRRRLTTILHVTGLTLGMTTCLLIGLFLRHELSFDTYHPNASSTYRINTIWVESGIKSYHFSTPLPLADAVRREFTGLSHVTQAHPLHDVIVEVTPEKRFNEGRVLVVDPDFINVFKVTPVTGNPAQVLAKPYQALLTESTAKKYFGSENPVGKVFKLKNQFDITVGGIIKDFPPNTHLPATMLLSFVANDQLLDHGMDQWTNVSGTETFIVLGKDEKLSRIDTLLRHMADEHINSNPFVPKYSRTYFNILPLGEIHYDGQYGGGGPWIQAINPNWLWFFGLIGGAVLILACINFMNLSTAQAMQRAREVGVRKSIGAGRLQLIMQFLVEAWALTTFAGILSVSITLLTLPLFNTMLEKGIVFDLFDSLLGAILLVGAILIIGLIAGLYPAWVISRFNPAKTLKASISASGDSSSAWLRKALVVAQFSISAGLLIALMLIAEQVNFIRHRNLGFDKDNVITVALENTKKTSLFMDELQKIPQVKDVACATATPTSQLHWSTMLSRISRDDPNQKSTILILGDDQYLKLYDLRLIAGRSLQPADTNFVSRSLPDDKKLMKAVVNETLVRTLGFTSNEAAVGEKIWIGFNSGLVEIVGVIRDFNTGTLHTAIQPTVVTQNAEYSQQAGIKIQKYSDMPATIAEIEKVWQKVYPQGVFEFKFLDDQINSFYKGEEKLYGLFKIFAGIAMLISCLGLWGLAVFAAQQRTREVGIRKVLGASVKELIVLLSKDFVILVLGALIMASPLAYFLVNNWLEQFAFHINIGWDVFVLAGMISLTITLLTVGFQAFRAAMSNPVVALKNE